MGPVALLIGAQNNRLSCLPFFTRQLVVAIRSHGAFRSVSHRTVRHLHFDELKKLGLYTDYMMLTMRTLSKGHEYQCCAPNGGTEAAGWRFCTLPLVHQTFIFQHCGIVQPKSDMFHTISSILSRRCQARDDQDLRMTFAN